MPGTASEFDVRMMQRAIRLAMNGRGRVEPNPMVGCVIVKDGRVIGEGFHHEYGAPHAEPTALAACTESTEGATAYVTLEPCCHTNKKTPPCTPRLIEAKIARVVVGSVDPNPEVNGQGLDQLRAAGIEVTHGVLEESAKQLLAPFIGRTVYDRPYVTLKWAETADGKVAGPRGERLQISNERSTRAVHELRARSDAILVGINTVINDDPLLTARGVENPRRLIRTVLDARLRIPMSSKLVRTARQERVFVHYDRYLMDAEREKVRMLREAGVEPFISGSTHAGLRLDEVLNNLSGFGATHVLVEPGPTLARSFLDQATLTDRVWLIISPKRSSEVASIAGVGIPASYVKTGEIDSDGDRLIEFLNPASPLFFSAEPSADFLLLTPS
ncbi:MAG: diaminohydroxyphosphoribosylaminopyrimidine deaminase [Phycisphaerales bacterium]|jgi:diaminohydroxyphosphoribosylaminopyrimidine deaminase/5-amino-6-(5-phosphoribosylamino)uracil reductase|nr:diaminohydroxyphosphoribosylaminopyrimidine deaminase [Phycisphaerales bacterium]